MTPDIQAILDLLQQSGAAHSALGILGALGVAVYGLVRISRLALVQSLIGKIPKIGPKLQWVNLPKWGCLLIVFGLSAIGTLLSNLAAHLSWAVALGAAFSAGLTAIGIDQSLTVVKK